MPFEIVRNDIVKMRADAIVNTTNSAPLIGAGVDAAIHAAAGPALFEARRRTGTIPVGKSAITPAFGLDAGYVIHTVAPHWQGGEYSEAQLLRSCYTDCLHNALNSGCKSIAFPLMSAGNHGFPKPLALKIATDAIADFLLEQDMTVYLVVYDKEVFRLSEKLFNGISSYIDENYISAQKQKDPFEDLPWAAPQTRRERFDIDLGCLEFSEVSYKSIAPPAQAQVFHPVLDDCCISLEDMLKETDAGFTETLFKLIDRSGKKDSEIYNRANISRQHFSKIRNNPDYRPTKPTAIALAIALELDMEETCDLIGRAGFTLTKSSKFDVIIMYFIQNRNYNMFDINSALFRFDQSLLGC